MNEYLLTDQFVEFSQKITNIHAQLKALKESFKEQYDEFTKQKSLLEDQKEEAVKEWEDWVAKQRKAESEEE
jgi:regulator of replication initiation timing